MHQLKKKQHYVWKEYLKPWCSDNKIFTYLKPSNKTVYSNLDGIAQERFHYSLQEFTVEEEQILEDIVKQFSIPELIDMNLEFYETLVLYSKIKRELSKKDLLEGFREELNKRLSILQRNTVEDVHMRVESLGKKLIISKSLAELEILFNQENRFSSLAFICMQYLRTKKMRLSYQELAKTHDYLKEKYSDIISIVFANNLAWALAFYQKCNIVLLKNETSISFVTADQPAVNSKLHIKNENGYVGDFELYYPLSPFYALLIQVKEKEKENSIETRSIKLEEVIKFNQSIFNYSEMFVFGIHNSSFPIQNDCL